MNKLYRFSWSFRGGDIESLFVATDKELEGALGKDVYFGEVLANTQKFSEPWKKKI